MIPFKVLQVDANPLDLDAALQKEVPGYPGDPGSSEVVTYFVASAFGVLDREPDERILERARALQTLHVSKAPWNDAFIFEKVSTALNGFEPDHELLESSSPAEMAVTACVMKKIKPENDFGPDVLAYIRGAMRDAGIVCYPKCLSFAQEEYKTPEMKELCSRVGSAKEYVQIHQEGMTYEPHPSEPFAAQLHKLSLVQDYVNGIIK